MLRRAGIPVSVVMAVKSDPPPDDSPLAVDCFQDDTLRKLHQRAERRNQRMMERLLSWVEVLDALGWSVALRLPDRLVLSANASVWLSGKCVDSPRWEDIAACLEEDPPGRHVMATPRLHFWASDDRSGEPAPHNRMEESLSPRESEVVRWLREGKTGPEIAIVLGLSRRTVESHVARIYRKLGLNRRSQLLFGHHPDLP